MNDPRHNNLDWDMLLHQELKRLPPLEAPPQLMAAVLRETRRRAALPWWKKSFWFWPPAVRAMVFIALVGLGTACTLPSWFGLETLSQWVGGPWVLVDELKAWPPGLGGWDALLDSPAGLASWLTQSSWFMAGLLLAGLLYLTCVAAGSALFRLVLASTQGR